MSLLMLLAVATQTPRTRFLRRQRFEVDDLRDVSAAFYVRRARTMAGLATVTVLKSGFEVWSLFEVVLVYVLVTCLAGIRADIFGL